MSSNRNARNGGFSLIELIIVVVIIGIIAAIAIPKMSRGARNAGANTLKMDLSVLRNAIELYAAEHDGKYPSAEIGNELTQYSNFTGTVTSATKNTGNGVVYGPYLNDIPVLPVGSKKGTTAIYFTNTGGELPPQGAAPQGWFWNGTDQVLKANLPPTDLDDDGIPYNSY